MQRGVVTKEYDGMSSTGGSAVMTVARCAAVAAVLAFGVTAPAAQQMSLPGNFDVSASGAATYDIAIAVPPGTAGMVPALKLSYSSQGGNGILGAGWSLSGLFSISRCAQTKVQDGVRGAVAFSAGDQFCMDGQRLVVSGASFHVRLAATIDF
jgi:Salmonella virulence plasmid 65kDa B protein